MTNPVEKFAGLKIPDSVTAASKHMQSLQPKLDAVENLQRMTKQINNTAKILAGLNLDSGLAALSRDQYGMKATLDVAKDFGMAGRRMADLAKSISANSCATRLAKQIADQRGAIDAIRAARPTIMPRLYDYDVQRMPEIRIPPNPIHETNKRLARIEDRFNRMETIAVNAAEIATSLQASAGSFLVKFEQAASDNDRTSGRAIKLGVFAIVIAIFVPLAQTLYTELWRAPADSAAMQAIVADMKAEIAGLQATQKKAADDLAAVLDKNDGEMLKSLASIRELLAAQKKPIVPSPKE